MKTPFAVLVVALAVLVTACGSLGPTAGTVNGSRIGERSVNDEMVQVRDNRRYREARGIVGVEGEGRRGTFRAGFAAQVLTLQIYYDLVAQELARRHLAVTRADRRKAREALARELGTDPTTGEARPQAGEEILSGFSKEYQDTLVRRGAEVSALRSTLGGGEVSDTDVKRYYDAHRDEFAQVCAMHVLADTRADAERIKAELSGGADFGQVAQAQSKDPMARQNKGDLGCTSTQNYVQPFAAALASQPVGQLGAPVQTQFGWHVIKVYDRKQAPLAAVSDQIRQQLGQQGVRALNDWLQGALQKATITVNPKFGQLERNVSHGELPRVVPPSPPTPAAGAPPAASGRP